MDTQTEPMKWRRAHEYENDPRDRVYASDTGAIIERITNLSGARAGSALRFDRRYTWQIARSDDDQWEAEVDTLAEAKRYAEENFKEETK